MLSVFIIRKSIEEMFEGPAEHFALAPEGSYYVKSVELVADFPAQYVEMPIDVWGNTKRVEVEKAHTERESIGGLTTTTFTIKGGAITVLPFYICSGKALSNETVEDILVKLSDYRNADDWGL